MYVCVRMHARMLLAFICVTMMSMVVSPEMSFWGALLHISKGLLGLAKLFPIGKDGQLVGRQMIVDHNSH